MTNKILKSSFHEKLKMLLITIGLLVTSLTSPIWGAVGYESSDCGIKYSHNGGSDTEWNFSGQTAQTKELTGNTSALYLKQWFAKMYQNEDGTIYGQDYHKCYYKIHRTAVPAGTTGFTEIGANWWDWTNWDGGGYRHPKGGHNDQNVNLLSGLGSGKYTMTFYFQHNGKSTYKSTSNTLKWTYNIVPNVSSFAVTPDNVVSGTGTSGDPYIITYGQDMTLTVSGSKASTDANSTLYAKFGNDSYSSTLTKAYTVTTSVQNVTVKAKYYNSADDLSGAEQSKTIYYKTVLTPSIGLSAPSTAVRGDAITLTATPSNATTPTIKYQYSTSSTFASSTQIASTTNTTQSWTVPAGTDGTTYYLRAQMTISGTTYSSSILTLTAYGKKTIHVKNTNNWTNVYLYTYNSETNGSFPGKTGAANGAEHTAGQWWDITITSQSANFILSSGNSSGGPQTSDLAYTSYTDGSCYAIGSGTGKSLSLSSSSCPSAPDVTTAAAGSFTNAKATLNASEVAANNDAITAYGFKWGPTTACANTQAASNLSSSTFSYQLTGLTAGQTYFFKAYATNGQGTTYGEVKSFTVPYKVTITKPTGCSAMTPGTSTQYVKVGDAITATAATGYQFSSWTVSNLTLSTPSTTSGVTTSTITDISSDNGTITAVYNPITYSNLTLGKTTGSADGKYRVTYNATSLTVTTAPTKTGYSVEGYYKSYSSSTWTTKVATANGTLQASTGYTDADKKWTSTASPTLYTKWTANNYTITLHDNNGGSHNGTATATYDSNKLTSITAPTRTGYHLVDGYYKESGKTNKISDLSGNLQASTDYTTSGSLWKSTSNQTLYAKWAANTYTIKFSANDAQYVGPAAKGTTASIAATYGKSYTLTASGFAKEGYTFNGWNSQADGGGTNYTDGQTVSNLTSTNNGTKWLYAKWIGKTYTITFNPRGGSGLSKTSQEVIMGSAYGELATVTPPAGYVFDGWYTSSVGGTKVTAETLVETASDHTLYAHYVEKAQVYFKNTLGWSKVYVTYDAYWDSGNPSKGSGNSGRTTHLMTLVAGTTDVYYDDIPDAILSSWKGSIVFYNEQQDNYANFNKGQAVFRRDFDSDATMFVPVPNDPNKFTLNAGYGQAGTTYYSTDQVVDKSGDDVTDYRYKNGYWVRYNNVEAGYSLKGSWDNWAADHYIAKETASGTTYTYTIRGLSANTKYTFKLFKHCATSNTYSSQFSNTGTMTSGNCSNWTFNAASTTGNAGIKTTVAGDYTFNFTFGDGEVKLSVEYPVRANDYRVVYTWNDGSAHTYNSEIIRAAAGTNETISVFIHSSSDASSRTLKIAKCTDVNSSGVESWNNNYGTITIPSSIKESGVSNFIITQNGSAAATGAYWNKYTGNYYIRTAASDGGWDMYKYRPDNIMTLSEYSLTQTLSEPYSHYYCRFIESTDIDITYAVATDYSPNISGKLVGDATIGGVDKTKLPASANVRFTYNEKTNGLRRAYLKNAQGDGNTRFLVLHGRDSKIFNADGSVIAKKTSQSLEANELLFSDLGNWVYQVELEAQPGANVSLIARYNGETSSADRYLIGSSSSGLTIMGGSGTTKYDILAVYDFKTNRLMTVWKPSGDITQQLTNVDVLLIRHAQDAGKSITFNGGTLTTKKVYGALEFQYDELVGHVAAWTRNSRPLLKFFVSFPFDVNVSDIFGLNSAYGEAYIIQKYDGEERASKGFFRGDGTTTFWKTLKAGDVMKANVGYSVIMDNDYLNYDAGHIWDNKSAGSKVYLYFPSVGNVGSIASKSVTIPIPEHKCEIDRTFNSLSAGRELNHKNTDSNWNMMGVPIFDNHSDNGTAGQPGAVFADVSTYPADNKFNYFFAWSSDNNQFSVHTAKNYEFKSMHGYMVQYHGNVTFKAAATPAAVAARRAQDMKEYQLELQVMNSDEEVINRTYVELREQACDTFELNEDVYMTYNDNAVNVYTLAGNYDVAANVLSVGHHIIPVCVEVNKAGTYTFSSPSNFSGKATLIDNFTGERIDLSMRDYEVELPKEIIEDRFLLELDIEKVTTAIDGANDGATLKDGKAHKFLQNGILYILQNGILYDAQGKRVQ